MSNIILPDRPTGQQLVDAIHDYARQTQQTPMQVSRALSNDSSTWLRTLASANRPLPRTVERVRALLAGASVPPPRRYKAPVVRLREPTEQIRWAEERIPVRTLVMPDPSDPRRPAFSREPCTYCGTRGDLGCKHQSPFLEEVRLATG